MYTMQRFLVVMIGAALASIAGAQSMPYQPPPDAQQPYQAPPPDGPGAYGDTAPAQSDPPGRVARLSYLNGEVSFTPAGEENWVQAQVNRPVVTGDKLWTDADAHAELSLGAATVRLDRSSSFDFLNLDDQLAQMELTQGTLNLNVRRVRGNETYEVDTPTIAFVANRDGDYRINVDPNGGTTVTAWRGSGDAVGEGGRRVTIEEGQSVVFNDSQLSNPLVSQINARNQGVPRNDFDTFVSEREQRYTQASHQYVSDDVVGYEDLDQYGTWEDAPQYGHVWYPRDVAADWAPYHDGHWAWIDPWGWTWVDNAPWGYAPSHYGRWSYVGSRWGWVPGPVNVAPVYAPAFVAFVGGGGVSVGFSVGGPVGWFALGPSDVYFPGYRCGRDYFARVNYGSAYVSHTVINNYYGGWSNGSLNYSQMHYANRDAPRAMTAMRGDAFVAGRPVAGAAIAVNRETFANAHVAPRANLMPTRESLVAGRSRATAPPATAINRPVIAANRPAPTAPSFEQRQALLQRNGGQPLSRNQMRTLATQQPANTRGAAANNVRVVGNNNRGNAAGATAQTNARAPNNGRVAGQTPSRAPEMNRSPEHANAQYQRSAGFAHQGVVPGSERATNAQQGRANSSARETAQSRENAQGREARNVPQPNRSEQANRGNAPQNAQHLNSSAFAHGGGQNNARGSASTTQQREEAAARSNAQQREHTATANAARENAQARSNAMAQQNAREQNARDQSRAQSNANDARAEASARSQANARAEANARASANARAESNARASANARAAESAQQSRMAQSRAQEQQRAAAAEQQSRASSQARAQQQQRAQQENRAVAQERAHAQQQQQQQQREAQIQRSQQQRAQPQVAHSPPQQRSEPVTRSQPQQQVQRAPVQQRSEPQPQVAHTPPPQQQQRAQPQQHQVARSTPQQRQPAPKKEKDKDNPGGG